MGEPPGALGISSRALKEHVGTQCTVMLIQMAVVFMEDIMTVGIETIT